MSSNGTLASGLIHITIVESIAVVQPTAHGFLGEQARELGRIVDLLRKKKLNRLILDLSHCEQISSEGLGIIASCWHWYHDKQRGQMGVVLPRSGENEVVNLFDITGLSHAIGSALQRSVRDAVQYVKTFTPRPKKSKKRIS